MLVAVFNTMGVNVPIKTMTTLGTSPMPSSMIISGIQAMGGIGRSTSNSVPKIALNVLFQPIRIPKGIPMPQEMSSASSTLFSEAHMWPQISWLLMGWVKVLMNRWITVTGDGTRTLFRLDANTQMPISRIIRKLGISVLTICLNAGALLVFRPDSIIKSYI